MSKDQLVFGIRAIQEAIVAGKEIEKVLIKKGLQGELFKELLEAVRVHDIPFQFVPIEKLNKLTRKSHQGVIAMISPVVYQDLDQIIPMLYDQGKEPFILVLDHVTDIRNFGAIARTAECTGVHAIVIPEKGGAPINADAIKTSAGALLTIPVCRVRSLDESVEMLKNSGLKIVAVTEKGAELYCSQSYDGPVALIMGAEDTGISNSLLRMADVKSKIPIVGEIESLNVSVAAGIMMYEVLRGRQ